MFTECLMDQRHGGEEIQDEVEDLIARDVH
jgi:hypothetical protein